MDVAVLGAGVIGVSTAWHLNQLGCNVTVIEREADVALKTSYANVGQLTAGMANPWASPGILRKAILLSFARNGPLKWSLGGGGLWKWLWHFSRNARRDRYLRNMRILVSIADYSRRCTDEIAQELGIQYYGTALGNLQLFRSRKQLNEHSLNFRILEELEEPYQILDRAGLCDREPNLADGDGAPDTGVLFPSDRTGDCRLFTQGLADACKHRGVEFLFGADVTSILHENRSVHGVAYRVGAVMHTRPFNAVVVAAGIQAKWLLESLHVQVPLYPIKGYSLTARGDCAAAGPVSTVGDQANKVGVTSLGDRLRVGGIAELSGYEASPRVQYFGHLRKIAKELFPKWPDDSLREAECWTGLRACMPTSLPVLGECGYRNLYLNLGHGSLGWTLSAGCARIVADLVTSREPELPSGPFSLLSRGGT